MKYDWLLFDADDTLFDFSRAEANALRWTLEENQLAFQSAHIGLYSRINQAVWQEFERGEVTAQELRIRRFRLFFDNIGTNIDPVLASRQYLVNLARGTDLIEDAFEVIQHLKNSYHLALVTNGFKDVQRPRLEKSLLKNSFEKIFISEEIGAAKPSAAFFEAVFAEMQRPPVSRVLIIGDSLSSDIRGGIDYGLDTCWFNPKASATDLAVTYQIRALRDLLVLL